MSAFEPGWLQLREPFDLAARAEALQGFDLPAVAAGLRRGAEPLGVLDLGAGTGANLRALAPSLEGRQRWTLVDQDARLLAEVPACMADWCRANQWKFETDGDRLRVAGPAWEVEVQRLQLDLDVSLDRLPWSRIRMVTASALLDLVSARWFDALSAHAADAGAALLFGLNVDGRLEWSPQDSADGAVSGLFAWHQLRDKGFGPALGIDAAEYAGRRLRERGFRTSSARSDWWLDSTGGGTGRAMYQAMVDGFCAAAIEHQPGTQDLVRDWQARRLALASVASLRVGHVDLLALPPQARGG
ncbi:conserved hypothetical protein [Burkholderiales bacterium 8X]|nr:conserved hypothetical protein [Burkholderiales bacterium 8X]